MQRVDPAGGAPRACARRSRSSSGPGLSMPVGQRAARDQALHEVRAARPPRRRRAPGTTFGWSIFWAALTSRRKRRRNTSSCESSVVTTFSATGSPPSCGALEDDPHAPAPDDPGDAVRDRGNHPAGAQARSQAFRAAENILRRPGSTRTSVGWSLAHSPSEPRHFRVISLMDRPKLGDYRIEGIVGVGRTGIVYLATDSRTGRAVALKVLREDVSIDPDLSRALPPRGRACSPRSATRT